RESESKKLNHDVGGEHEDQRRGTASPEVVPDGANERRDAPVALVLAYDGLAHPEHRDRQRDRADEEQPERGRELEFPRRCSHRNGKGNLGSNSTAEYATRRPRQRSVAASSRRDFTLRVSPMLCPEQTRGVRRLDARRSTAFGRVLKSAVGRCRFGE